MNKLRKNRQSLRLPNYDYSRNGSYFITICIKDRKCLLGEIHNYEFIHNEFGKIVHDIWNSLSIKYEAIELDEFIIMPNHIHGIITINKVGAIHESPLLCGKSSPKQRRKMLLPKAIGYFKMNSAKQINQIRQTSGIPLWQRNYYEHIIRNQKSLNNIRQYIINNPLKWSEDIENIQGKPTKNEIEFWHNLGHKNTLPYK